MIANLAVLKSFRFILQMTELFDRGRVAVNRFEKRAEDK